MTEIMYITEQSRVLINQGKIDHLFLDLSLQFFEENGNKVFHRLHICMFLKAILSRTI